MRLCNVVMPKLLVGEIGNTCRLGRKWFNQAQVGDSLNLCFCPDPDGPHQTVGEAKVIDIRLKTFNNLTDSEVAENHSGRDRQQLAEAMRRAYGEAFTEESEVTLLYYRRVG